MIRWRNHWDGDVPFENLQERMEYHVDKNDPTNCLQTDRGNPSGLEAGAAQHEAPPGIEIEHGPFEGTRASLSKYEIPVWFRDAKFGIWAHWGPQSAIEDGDWYARNMYMQGSEQNIYHMETYGHPSKFGYKDTIPLWKAEQFDPAYLIGLYKKAGAKYFMSMGVHHDNFDMWNSTYQPWNAANKGPKKDIVGMWAHAAREAGLKFAVSEHLWVSYKWFSVNHGHDETGPYAGVPYDGADPEYKSLYEDSDQIWANSLDWSETGIPLWWKRTGTCGSRTSWTSISRTCFTPTVPFPSRITG